MSVINQMLKDLGERQTRSEWRLADMLDRQAPAMKLPRNYRAASALLLAGGVLAAGVFLLQQQWSDRSAATPVTELAQDATTQKTLAVEPSAVIASIGIETDGESLRLVLESDRTLVQAVTQSFNADGSVDYTLANARIEAALPALAQNPFIKSYALTQRGADVVLRLVPAASALAFVEPAATGKGYRMVVGARAQSAGVAAAPKTGKAAPPAIQKAAQPRKQQAVAARSAPAEAGDGDGAEKIGITRSIPAARQAETYYRQGLEKLQADRIEAAVSDLRKAVGLQADMHSARELLAALLLRGGHSAEAYAQLQQGIQLNPGHTAFARLYAQSLTEAGDPAGALRVLEISEPYAAQQADYRALMAAVGQRLGRHEESVRHYMAALDLKPARSAWWVGMAISLEALGRAQDAARAYRTALGGNELNPDLMNYARERVAQLGVQPGEMSGGG